MLHYGLLRYFPAVIDPNSFGLVLFINQHFYVNNLHISAKILVVGGCATSNYDPCQYDTSPEVIDILDPSNECEMSNEDFNFDYHDATGGLLGDFFPYFCGGKRNSIRNSQCVILESTTQTMVDLNALHIGASSSSLGNAIHLTGGEINDVRYV